MARRLCLTPRRLPGCHRRQAHAFVRLLQDKGMLLRCYTQNIGARALDRHSPAPFAPNSELDQSRFGTFT